MAAHGRNYAIFDDVDVNPSVRIGDHMVLSWLGFCAVPDVRVFIEMGDHAAFQRVLERYKSGLRPSFLTSYVLADLLKYVFTDEASQLKIALFLLHYLDRERSAHLSWLWTGQLRVVEHAEWWYALMKRGLTPTCSYTAESVRNAFITGRDTWEPQKHTALLLFALTRRLLGRDVARLLAETVLKTNLL